ncbi:hypothetical protein G5I_05984 [Acromyrmex echinatior]|uniref:Uncharacterized protein n=1 Tax=Acromyrmex echinatior TaxID=103372 RepID=F4WJV0_ACREC|nr:hypothetical protein G5I_05984 [Acromyrmex echinatior]
MKNRSPLKTSFLKRDDTFRTPYDGLYRELTKVSSAKPLTPRKSEAHRKERPRTPNRVQRGLIDSGTVSSREEEDTGASTSEARKELSSDTCADLRSGRIGKASRWRVGKSDVHTMPVSKSKVEYKTWFCRGNRSKRSMILTYISGSISVSQQNITKLEREAGYRHANQVLTRNITVSTNNSQDFTLVLPHSKCMNRWLNRSDYASETGTSLVGRVRTRRTPNVRFTYKRCANAPADDGHVTPPHSPSSVSTYYEDTTFCDAVQLSPEPPPLPQCQPHHRRSAGTDVRTRSAGAQLTDILIFK